MPVITLIVVAITIIMNAVIVIGDLVRAEFVVGNSREVGVPDKRLPALAIVKGAGGGRAFPALFFAFALASLVLLTVNPVSLGG